MYVISIFVTKLQDANHTIENIYIEYIYTVGHKDGIFSLFCILQHKSSYFQY